MRLINWMLRSYYVSQNQIHWVWLSLYYKSFIICPWWFALPLRSWFVFSKVLSVQPSLLLGNGLLCGCFFGDFDGNCETAILLKTYWCLCSICILSKNYFQKVTFNPIMHDELLDQRTFSYNFVSCSFIQHLLLLI